ncbi:uncharacterized protein AAEQ78_018533 [Lycaon pictus]
MMEYYKVFSKKWEMFVISNLFRVICERAGSRAAEPRGCGQPRGGAGGCRPAVLRRCVLFVFPPPLIFRRLSGGSPSGLLSASASATRPAQLPRTSATSAPHFHLAPCVGTGANAVTLLPPTPFHCTRSPCGLGVCSPRLQNEVPEKPLSAAATQPRLRSRELPGAARLPSSARVASAAGPRGSPAVSRCYSLQGMEFCKGAFGPIEDKGCDWFMGQERGGRSLQFETLVPLRKTRPTCRSTSQRNPEQSAALRLCLRQQTGHHSSSMATAYGTGKVACVVRRQCLLDQIPGRLSGPD